jgi:hypothetical protein
VAVKDHRHAPDDQVTNIGLVESLEDAFERNHKRDLSLGT